MGAHLGVADELGDQVGVPDVAVDERVRAVGGGGVLADLDRPFRDPHVVGGSQIVESRHVVARLGERLREVAADAAGPIRYYDVRVRRVRPYTSESHCRRRQGRPRGARKQRTTERCLRKPTPA